MFIRSANEYQKVKASASIQIKYLRRYGKTFAEHFY